MLNFIGPAIPFVVANFLNPVRMGKIWRAVTEGVQFVQATMGNATAAEKKEAAINFAAASYDLADDVFGFSPEVDAYVKSTLIPAMVDGALLAFNASLWFATSKPVQVGGQNAPAPAAGVAYTNGAQPGAPVPVPPPAGPSCLPGDAQCQQ